MSNDEFNTLWEQFNSLEVEDLLHYSTISILSKLLQIVPVEKKEDLQKELGLGWTIQIASNWLQHFEPNFAKVKEEINIFVDKHKNDLEFYKARLKQAKTTLLKWHYSLACYFLERGDYLLEALKLILQSAKLALYAKSYLNCVLLLVTVYHLNKIYGLKFEKEINESAIQFFENLKNQPRFLIEPSEVIGRLGIVKGKELANFIDILVYKAVEEDSDHIFESLLNTAIHLCDADGKTELKKSIILRLAQKFEKRGDSQTEGMLMIHFYEQAQKEFQKLGDEQKKTELSTKIRQSYDKIEWKVIEHEIKLPNLKIPGKNGFEKVNSIANFADMIPNINKTEKLTDELKEKYPISSLFPTTSFNKKQPTSHSQTDEEIRDSKLKTEFIRTIRMMESILSINVKELEEKKEITVEDYFEYIKSFGLHDETSLAIIKRGIERHLDGDYISSIHVLIPQVEYTIRQLLLSRGIKTTSITNDIIRNTLLDILICRGVSFYGDDMTNYLKIKFTDMDGLNERNNVCHADADIADFNHSISLSIIYVIMVLTKLVTKK